MNISEMKVVKRNKQQEDVSFDKILNRVKNIGKELLFCGASRTVTNNFGQTPSDLLTLQ